MGDDIRTCQECGGENSANAKFCSQCATPLETTQAQEIKALEAAAAGEPMNGESTIEGPVEESTVEHTSEKEPSTEHGAPVVASSSSRAFTISRKKALVGGLGVLALIAGVTVALAISLSGGAKAHPTRASATQTESEPALTNPVTTEDTDGDGLADATDPDPY